MWRRRAVTPGADVHPADEALAALLEEEDAPAAAPGGRGPAPAGRGGAARTSRGARCAPGAWRSCGRCGASSAQAPSARPRPGATWRAGALARLRWRRAAVGGANELLATLAAFLRWVGLLLSGRPRAPDSERPEAAGGESGA